MLVVGAGLLIRSFMNLTRVDMGFNRSELLDVRRRAAGARYNPQQRVGVLRPADRRSCARMPGVQSVAAMSGLPPLRNVNANDTDFEHIPTTGRPAQRRFENVDYWQFVTVGYTDTMGIPVVQGRDVRSRPTSAARRWCS